MNCQISRARALGVECIYGMKKHFKVLGLHIDKPKDFKEALENAFIQIA